MSGHIVNMSGHNMQFDFTLKKVMKGTYFHRLREGQATFRDIARHLSEGSRRGTSRSARCFRPNSSFASTTAPAGILCARRWHELAATRPGVTAQECRNAGHIERADQSLPSDAGFGGRPRAVRRGASACRAVDRGPVATGALAKELGCADGARGCASPACAW